MTRTLVQEAMTTPVVTAAEAMPFRDLAALLYAQDIGAVPVVGPAGQLLGVVSRPDLIPKTAGLAAAAGLCPGFGSRRRERRRGADDRPAVRPRRGRASVRRATSLRWPATG